MVQKQSSPIAIQQAVQVLWGLNSAFQAADLKGQGALADAVGKQKMLLLADLQQKHKPLCGKAARVLDQCSLVYSLLGSRLGPADYRGPGELRAQCWVTRLKHLCSHGATQRVLQLSRTS